MQHWFKHIYFKSNIHGNYNIDIYINKIRSEPKHYSLFGSSPTCRIEDWKVMVLVLLVGGLVGGKGGEGIKGRG